jgi:acetyl-CoA acetyltransferase
LMDSDARADRSALDEVILGCASHAGEDNRNAARMRCCWRKCPMAFRASPSTACAVPA